MKKRFSEEQIVKALKRLDAGEKPKDLAREMEVHEQTFYVWKRKYSGLEVSDLLFPLNFLYLKVDFFS